MGAIVDLDADNSSGFGSSYETSFIPGGGPVSIADLDSDINDPGGSTIDSMTITITNLLDGANELLAADLGGTSIAIDSFVGGVLTLSGTEHLPITNRY